MSFLPLDELMGKWGYIIVFLEHITIMGEPLFCIL